MANFKVTKGGTLPKSSTKADVYALVDNAAVDIYNIDNADIVAAAGIPDSKLATIAMKNKVNLSALTIAGQTAGDILYSTDGVTFIRLPIGTAGQQLAISDTRTILDYMEYSTDELAQTTYVSDDDFAELSISTWNADAGSELAPNAGDNNTDTYWQVFGSTMPHWISMDLGSAKRIDKCSAHSKLDGASYARLKDFSLQYSDNNSDWITLQNFQHTLTEGNESFYITSPESHRYWRYYLTTSWNPSNYVMEIYEAKLFTVNLLCYTEGIIKQQGLYSLKVFAKITDSLNNTLTRTVSPVINLTDLTSIQFRIRASRTGANIKIGIHDSGGTTSEKTYTVVAANTWETVTWDISAVSNANKDAIDSIIITIVNADADNTFYLDFMFAGISPYDSEIGWVTP